MDSVRASHILVKNEYEAKDIARALAEGKSFEELAKKYSTCPSSAKGGDLGRFGRGRMVQEFEEAAFELEPQEISVPIRTKFGYHLIKRTE